MDASHRLSREPRPSGSALRLFPKDATLLFLGGAEHESFARPAIQAAARSVDLPPGYQLAVQTEEAEFRDAEAMFRRALAEAPEHFEARLRLGRVLLKRGRAREAAEELRRANAAAPDDLMKYYSAMFLGGAEEVLGNFDAADERYSRASMLYPNAQSPHVARSALARRRGDLAGALTSIERVFELAAEYPDGDDPWWAYDTAAGRESEALLDELTQLFMETAMKALLAVLAVLAQATSRAASTWCESTCSSRTTASRSPA